MASILYECNVFKLLVVAQKKYYYSIKSSSRNMKCVRTIVFYKDNKTIYQGLDVCIVIVNCKIQFTVNCIQ